MARAKVTKPETDRPWRRWFVCSCGHPKLVARGLETVEIRHRAMCMSGGREDEALILRQNFE
jgi:hypothetical protein